MTKQKTAKLDFNGQKVDVGISKDLLADLGGMVYFGALAQVVRDRKQATFPGIWTADTPEGADYATSVMAAFGSRFTRKLLAMPESEAQAKILTGEVLGWVADRFGIGMKEDSR